MLLYLMVFNIPSGFMCISQDFNMDADLCTWKWLSKGKMQ